MTGGTIGHRLDRWLDECKMALSGVVLATRDWRFLLSFAISFILFGTLLNLLSGSSAAVSLFFQVDFPSRLKIIFDGFLMNFGIGHTYFIDWLLIFGLTVLQSTLIGLVVLVWRKRKKTSAALKNAANAQDAGLAAGLAILGSGCPTCGTTLLAPVISTFASSGGLIIASFISKILVFASILLALFALKRVGKDAFVMLTSERYLKRHQEVDHGKIA